MRIAELAPLWKPVPPPKYGGSELVVGNLAKGLTARGHDVTTFACGGSRPAGKLVKVIDRPMYDLNGGFDFSAIVPYEFLAYDELLKRANDFDVVHNHMGIHALAFSRALDIPMVTTLHSSLPPDFPYLAERFKDRPFVSISNAQRTLAPKLNYIATVYHGIDTKAFKPSNRPGSYLLFVGTLSKNKGVDLAVKAARELREPLILAGETRREEMPFLKKEVLPFVDGKRIKMLAEVSHAEKGKLYAGAKALLFPIRWNEAFGLVMPEALACGTPVVGWSHGSVAEVIEHGKTGFVVETFGAFKRAIGRVGELSRETCRTEAERRFGLDAMAKGYEKVFETLRKKNR